MLCGNPLHIGDKLGICRIWSCVLETKCVRHGNRNANVNLGSDSAAVFHFDLDHVVIVHVAISLGC